MAVTALDFDTDVRDIERVKIALRQLKVRLNRLVGEINDSLLLVPVAGAAATTIEVNLGSSAVWCGQFTITDGDIAATNKVLCWQAPGPYTGKGTRADEAEMQPVQVIAVEPGSGSAVVKWQTPPIVSESPLLGRSPNFGGGTAANSGTNRDVRTQAIRLGKVRGNVKFSYAIFD